MSSDDTAQLEPAEPDEHASESDEPDELDEETRLRRDAALARVRKLGDPVLRASAVEVERFDEQLRVEIARMGELMSDALGVGLAANQVGVLHRVLVYRADPDEPISALVNPVIEWRSDELETAQEGCLSIPDVHVEVERPARVRTRARDAAGEEVVIEADGLEARVIQHEVDHLDGILILDRISREARRDAMRAAREARAAQTAEPSAGDSGVDGPGVGDRRAADPQASDRGARDRGAGSFQGADRGARDRGAADPEVGDARVGDRGAADPAAGGSAAADPDATPV